MQHTNYQIADISFRAVEINVLSASSSPFYYCFSDSFNPEKTEDDQTACFASLFLTIKDSWIMWCLV